jgi:hypothetical protein
LAVPFESRLRLPSEFECVRLDYVKGIDCIRDCLPFILSAGTRGQALETGKNHVYSRVSQFPNPIRIKFHQHGFVLALPFGIFQISHNHSQFNDAGKLRTPTSLPA